MLIEFEDHPKALTRSVWPNSSLVGQLLLGKALWLFGVTTTASSLALLGLKRLNHLASIAINRQLVNKHGSGP